MRILVTGGAGYIGSHTAVALLEAGHDVEIVDDLVNARPDVVDRIGGIAGRIPPLHVADIRDEDALDAIVGGGGFDAVVHFAGLKAVAESMQKPLTYYDVNVGGSATLFRVMDRHALRTVVFSSSATVYGPATTVPVTESSPTLPATNPYGRTKRMIEQILEDVHHADPRWNVALLRYFNPVGAHESGLIGEDPADRPNNLMPLILDVAAGDRDVLEVFGGDYPTPDGTGVRDYVHVMDLADGHLAALRRIADTPGLSVWNLGTGTPTSVLELVRTFEQVTGVEIPTRIAGRRPGDIPALWTDPSRARDELGWTARRGLEQMCADAWRFRGRSR